MNRFWSSRIAGLAPYVPGEQPKDGVFIKLNTNENPYPPSPKVREAISAALGDSLRLYSDPDCTGLRRAVAEQYGLKVEQVFAGNGSDEVLAFCFLALFSPGETIVFPDITYSFYPVYANFFGVPYRAVPLDEEFRIPVEQLCGGNRGVIFPNPNAPTGRALPRSRVERILQENPDVPVVVDEAYVDFGGESAVGLIGRYPNLLVIHTLSKFRALAGLRAGYAMGDENLIAALNCVKNSFNSYTMDRLALAGAEAAIRDTEYSRAVAEKIRATRDKTAERLKAMGFYVIPSAANFLFIRHETMQGKALWKGLRRNGILVRRFDAPRISEFLRVTVGTEEEMDALCRTLSALV